MADLALLDHDRTPVHGLQQRRLQHCLGRPRPGDAPLVEQHQAIGQLRGQAEIVGDHYDRRAALAVDGAQQIDDVGLAP
jgi:hypothetical protein